MDNKKKALLTGSLIAGALMATANLNANAADLFRFNNLGTGESVRARLMDASADGRCETSATACASPSLFAVIQLSLRMADCK